MNLHDTSIQTTVAFLEHHRPKLMAIARELLASDMQAKFGASDVVQQTLLDAWKDWPTVRSTRPEQLMSWLKKLLKNNMLDASKAFRKSKKRSLDRELSGRTEFLERRIQDPASMFISDEDLQMVWEAMRRLPSVHQQILRWHFLEGLSFHQIGDRVGRSRDATRMMCARCIKWLSIELSRDD